MRAAAAEQAPLRAVPAHLLPVGPSPTALFAGYPTAAQPPETLRLRASGHTRSVAEVLALRDYPGAGRLFAQVAQVELALDLIVQNGAAGASLDEIFTGSLQRPERLSRPLTERIAMWLLKYGFVQRV